MDTIPLFLLEEQGYHLLSNLCTKTWSSGMFIADNREAVM